VYSILYAKEKQAMSDNVTYTFDMDEKTHAKLKELAVEGHRTLAGQIRLILEEWLEENK